MCCRPGLQPTFCVADGWGFDKRLPGGNDDLERDHKVSKSVPARVRPQFKVDIE